MTLVKRFVSVLNVIFGSISLVFLLTLIYICINAIVSLEYRLDLSIAGIETFQDFWKDYSFLLKGFGGSATIFIAGYNLTR